MIRIFDTKMHRKVDFEPLEAGKVRMYVCGPTVYNLIHIGNARTFISFDVIRRYFEWRGYEVVFVQNVTDVDDKIINKANEEGRTAEEVAAEYTKAFIDDMHAVNVMDPTVRPKATEEIDTMIALVQRLIERGHAYATDEGDVYFDVRSFHSYGLLSGGKSSATTFFVAVDLSNHYVMIFRGSAGNWKLDRMFQCTNGTASTPTPTGDYTIGARGFQFNGDWLTYSCYYWTQFYGSYLFHSVIYNYNSNTVQDGRLGMYLSHGCVRLAIDNAKWIMYNVDSGSHVYIYN